MRKAYLLVYSNSLGDRDEVRECVDELPEIINWRHDMPNSFYLISEHDADDIAEAIREYFGTGGRFIVSEVTDNKQGWLPSKSWYLLNKKRHKKKAY